MDHIDQLATEVLSRLNIQLKDRLDLKQVFRLGFEHGIRFAQEDEQAAQAMYKGQQEELGDWPDIQSPSDEVRHLPPDIYAWEG